MVREFRRCGGHEAPVSLPASGFSLFDLPVRGAHGLAGLLCTWGEYCVAISSRMYGQEWRCEIRCNAVFSPKREEQPHRIALSRLLWSSVKSLWEHRSHGLNIEATGLTCCLFLTSLNHPGQAAGGQQNCFADCMSVPDQVASPWGQRLGAGERLWESGASGAA